MATFIEMPKLSDTMTEGTLLKWHVEEGDTVSAGNVIADVETDKATMEMEAFDEGIVGRLYVAEGQKAVLGSVLAALVEEGEEAPAEPPAGKAEPEAAAQGKEKSEAEGEEGSGKVRPRRRESSRREAEAEPHEPVRTSGGRIKASPLARKVARKQGVDLARVRGTGPGGRIVRADVDRAVEEGGAETRGAGGAASVQAIRPTMEFDPEAERLSLSGMRTIIAERLQISKSTIPHFYLNVELDAEPLMALRKEVNASAESSGNKFTVNDFVLKAVVLAAADVPEVNAAWDVDGIIRYQAVNLSVAIAVPDGLVTPVVRNAEGKTLLDISREVKDLAERAKNKKLSPEFAGGTLTVSNLGSYGIDQFDAIINPPQAVILSIGTIRKVPVVTDDGELEPGLRMWVGMSCDHRVVDGAVGASYLQALRKYMENPALMLV